MNVTKKTEGQTPEPTTGRMPSTVMSPFLTLRDDLDRMFDSFLLTPFSRRLFEIEPLRRRGMLAGDVTPRMDVVETEQAIALTAELPGITEKDVEISIAEGMLTIRGEKRQEHDEKTGDYHLSERSYGSFTRSLRLPENVDEEHIEATVEKGVLTVTIPKTAMPTPEARKIEVKGRA
jgi:HSP20 family protein